MLDHFEKLPNEESLHRVGNDQEIKFQEIEIHIFHEINTFSIFYQEIEKALGVIISGFFLS